MRNAINAITLEFADLYILNSMIQRQYFSVGHDRYPYCFAEQIGGQAACQNLSEVGEVQLLVDTQW